MLNRMMFLWKNDEMKKKEDLNINELQQLEQRDSLGVGLKNQNKLKTGYLSDKGREILVFEIGRKDLLSEFIEVIYDEGIAIFGPGHYIIEFCVLEAKWQKYRTFRKI